MAQNDTIVNYFLSHDLYVLEYFRMELHQYLLCAMQSLANDIATNVCNVMIEELDETKWLGYECVKSAKIIYSMDVIIEYLNQ